MRSDSMTTFPSAAPILIVGLVWSSAFNQEKPDLATEKLKLRAAEFVQLLDKGDFTKATSDFDATMRKVMPPEELKKTWQKVLDSAGAYKKQAGSRFQKSGIYQIVFVTCEFSKISLDTKVVFDQDGKITGLFFTPVQKTPPASAETWEGKLKVGAMELRLVFHVFKQKDGSYGGTMDSPDQGAKGLALDEVSLKDDRVRFVLKSAGVAFEGKRAKDGQEIAGEFKQAGQSIPLTLKTGDEVLYSQAAAMLRIAGASQEELARQKAFQQRIFSVVRQEKGEAAEQKIRAAMKDAPTGSDERIQDVMPMLEGQVQMVLSPWFRHFLDYDPRPALRKTRCPVLALDGEKDLQVDAKTNLKAIAEALKEGGNNDFTVRELPNLNHLFQTCKTGAVSEYNSIEETLAPVVLETIADWILARCTR